LVSKEESVKEDLDSLSFDLVGEHYYYWIENNVFKPSFLFYFLKRYYSIPFTMEEMKNYQIQIITKEMDIFTVSLYEEQQFKVLEKGFEIIDNVLEDVEDVEDAEDVEEETQLRRSKRERKSSKSKTE
jgi:hypothetical protein